MPQYDFVFPSGLHTTVALEQRVKFYDVVSRHGELFGIAEVVETPDVQGHISEPIRVELEEWPAKDVVLGRVLAIPDPG